MHTKPTSLTQSTVSIDVDTDHPLLNWDKRNDVVLFDQPCGSGKTSLLLNCFEPDHKYLIVVPTLDEVDRVIADANVAFVAPSETDNKEGTKRESLRAMLESGVNIVCTHALYLDVALLASWGLMSTYHVLVDEVISTCEAINQSKEFSYKDFDLVYVREGYATVDEEGRVLATPKWDAIAEEQSTLKQHIYWMSKAGVLFLVDNSFFMWTVSPKLITQSRSFTCLTYLAHGSMLYAFLNKRDIPFIHYKDEDMDRRFRQKARQLITIDTMPTVSQYEAQLTYSKQTRNKELKEIGKKIANCLKWLRQTTLKDASPESVIVTCVKENWFKKGDALLNRPSTYSLNSRMFNSSTWIPNTTRGTNKYIDSSHVIYLYDQHLNPYIMRWLGLAGEKDADSRYAVSELIQLLYRSRIRRGEPVTLYLPSSRMRRLLQKWLDGDL